jgi:hypothetical protein
LTAVGAARYQDSVPDDIIDYWYLHEEPTLTYMVRVSQPPANISKADFHKNNPAGPVFHREPNLVKQGNGTIPLNFKRLGLELTDSPLFAEFTFQKWQDILPRKHLVALSLAEPAVRSIEAPPEVDPDETFQARVTAWDARAYDQPRIQTQFIERQPERIPAGERAKTQWERDGQGIPPRGETISTKVGKEYLGKYFTLEAYYREKPRPRQTMRIDVGKTSSRLTRSRLQRSYATGATAQVAVPRLVVEGPDLVEIGSSVAVIGRIEPSIQGTYAWTLAAGEGRVQPGALEGASVDVQGLKESQAEKDVTLQCTFTSKATGKKYKGEHKLTVAGPPVLAAKAVTQPHEPELVQAKDETEPHEPELVAAKDATEPHEPELVAAKDATEPHEPELVAAKDATEPHEPDLMEARDETEPHEPDLMAAKDETEPHEPYFMEAKDETEPHEPYFMEAKDETEAYEPAFIAATDETEAYEPAFVAATDETEGEEIQSEQVEKQSGPTVSIEVDTAQEA